MADSIIAIQEERVRVGGVDVTKKTMIAATDEGVVAVQVHSVEQSQGYGQNRFPAIQHQPMPVGALPPPVMYTDNRTEKNCCARGWCECDSGYKWYSCNGKGWGVVLLLLLMYLIVGVIAIPLCILGACCACCSNDDD